MAVQTVRTPAAQSRIIALSSDARPATANVGAVLYEIDTGAEWTFDGATWLPSVHIPDSVPKLLGQQNAWLQQISEQLALMLELLAKVV